MFVSCPEISIIKNMYISNWLNKLRKIDGTFPMLFGVYAGIFFWDRERKTHDEFRKGLMNLNRFVSHFDNQCSFYSLFLCLFEKVAPFREQKSGRYCSF